MRVGKAPSARKAFDSQRADMMTALAAVSELLESLIQRSLSAILLSADMSVSAWATGIHSIYAGSHVTCLLMARYIYNDCPYHWHPKGDRSGDIILNNQLFRLLYPEILPEVYV